MQFTSYCIPGIGPFQHIAYLSLSYSCLRNARFSPPGSQVRDLRTSFLMIKLAWERSQSWAGGSQSPKLPVRILLSSLLSSIADLQSAMRDLHDLL